MGFLVAHAVEIGRKANGAGPPQARCSPFADGLEAA